MCEVTLERLAGESARAYRLAQLYCELGAGRSLARVREAYAQESGVVLSLRQLKRLSSRFGWVERARAWDAAVASARAERMREARLALEESVLAAARGVCRVLSSLGDGGLVVQSAGDVLRLAQALEVLMGLLPSGEGGVGRDVLGQLAALSRMLGGEGWRRVLMEEASAYGAGGGVGCVG
jgi:hypothetical protein